MKKNFLWAVLTVLVIGCSGGSGGSDDHDDDEDGRTSATPVANHPNVTPGTCATCHNGITAEGKDSGHISTTASCDTCHLTTDWEPATMGHGNVMPGTCATCHDGDTAEGKDSGHISTTASCDVCHLTTNWKPANVNHANVTPGSCTTCHNGASAQGKPSGHVATSASCDSCHQTTGWKPATTGTGTTTMDHSSVTPGSCATCHNGTNAQGKPASHASITASCDTCHQTTGWILANNGTSSVSTLDFPVEAVLVSLASTSATYSASSVNAAGNSLLMSFSRVPGPDKVDTQIYSSSLKTYAQSNTITSNGNIVSTQSFEDFYSTAPFNMFGSLNNLSGSSNTMKVATQYQAPQTGRVGDSGLIYKGRNYINGSLVTFDTWYTRWSLEADSESTAWLCLNIKVTLSSGVAAPDTEFDCFRINQAGDILGFRADIVSNGVTLSYR